MNVNLQPPPLPPPATPPLTIRRILVHHNQRPRVQLQRRQRPQMVDPLLNRLAQCERLLQAGDHDDDLP